MVKRPSEVKEILKLLLEGNNRVGVVGSRSGDVIGIRGMGGLGKTVLAQAIAWAAHNDGREVIWIDIGQSPDCLALINNLIKALGGTGSFSDISTAQDWVKENTVCMHLLFFVILMKAMQLYTEQFSIVICNTGDVVRNLKTVIIMGKKVQALV